MTGLVGRRVMGRRPCAIDVFVRMPSPATPVIRVTREGEGA